ncbi:hypothetical protein DXG03_007351 [Asterophora parasitica]|uniref:F-box domain-containing protein n=1 Tax=Asterophora parasitica TaxID=117018 RepID=A0A9P7G6X8_9AGAR|nr:hypothetical protein DXG03_007351 [Asterophora parasitica]
MDYGKPNLLDPMPVEFPPYLLILGKEERMAQSEENRLRLRASLGKADASELEEQEGVVLYHRNFRIFRSIKGFHTGYLDLTGRHLHRYIEIVDRFLAYAPDLCEVKKLETEFTFDEKDWSGVDVTYIDYKFSDDGSAWDAFRKKWKISPRFSFGRFVEQAQKTATLLQTGGPPSFQKLCLDHLPPKILDRIYEFASLGDARIISCTCRIRSLVFEHPDGRNFRTEKSELDLVEHQSLALASSDRLTSTVDFLLKHPELIEQLQTLTI